MPEKNEYKSLRAETKLMLEGQEGREVDFKEAPGGVKPEDFVAFANTIGGSILVGVRETTAPDGSQKGIIVGCSISDQTRQNFISTAASCRPSISITVSIENLNTDKPIYRIDIPEGAEKPYCTSSGTYKYRAEGQRVAIDPTQMQAIILERESEKFVARFKAAGDALLERIGQVYSDLSEQINRVERIAKMAEQAAFEAGEAANAARDAADEARDAAENAGDGGW